MKNKLNNVTRTRIIEKKRGFREVLPSGTIPSNGSDRISIRSVSQKEKVGSADRARSRAVRFFFFFFLNGGHGSLRPNYTCRPGPGDQKLRQEVKGRECIVKLPLSKHSACSQVTNTHALFPSILPSSFSFLPFSRFQPRSLPPSFPLEEFVREVSAGNPKKWIVGFRRYEVERHARIPSTHTLSYVCGYGRTHVRDLLEFPRYSVRFSPRWTFHSRNSSDIITNYETN